MTKSMLVLGATGFIGQQVVREAVSAGWHVSAIARSAEGAAKLSANGASPVLGKIEDTSSWSNALSDVQVVIDLVQPKLPPKLTLAAIQSVAGQRLQITQRVLDALAALPASRRPLLISVSGTDDLQPDEHRRIGANSPLKQNPTGFSHIGIPVRRCIERSGLDAAFAYFGSVYGPGKTFAETILPRIVSGKWKTIGNGDNHLPFIHVDDAARALVHLAGLERNQLIGRNFVLADETPVPSRDFFDHTAMLAGARKPGTAPRWLASLIAGSIMVETLTRDLIADISAIKETGFRFKYPSFREGLEATLRDLGHTPAKSEASSEAKSEAASRRRLPFWAIAVVTFGTLIAENTLHFKWSVPSMQARSNGLPLLDMRFNYTPEDAHRLFEALGADGRTAYLELLWSVDILIPLLAMTFLWAALSRGAFRQWRRLALVGGCADYLENIAITTLLLNYPARMESIVYVAATFTLIKHLGYISATGLAAAGFVRTLLPRKRRAPTTTKLSCAA
jgi:nucleoside-diphosphate-sugar epimerase